MRNPNLSSGAAGAVVIVAVLAATMFEYHAYNAHREPPHDSIPSDRAHCAGKCHTEPQLAALIAKKNDIKTTLTYVKWDPNSAKGSEPKYTPQQMADVERILSNYFPNDKPGTKK